jgi:TonB family protein
MPKPLRSEDPRPRDISFTHFGVLNTGAQSKSSLFTSITINVLLGLICLIIGAATKKVVDNRNKEISYVVPLPEKPPPPPPVKMPPPPKLPPPPKVVETPEPPKIKLPDVKIPDPPKPVAVATPKPAPVITPAPPKVVIAAAAPKPTDVHLGQSASIPNHDLHPSEVKLGATDNPLKSLSGPAVSNVNLGNRGVPGMPAGNTGNGPPASKVSLGSGQPNGGINGTGARAIAGVKLGVTGGTGTNGNGTGTSPQQVTLARAVPPPAMPTTSAVKAPAQHPPQVLFKPTALYTPEARSLHIEGKVVVKVQVSASGTVTVLGVSAGLGHGLDQNAVTAAQGMRFKPATDATGNSVDWEGPVSISFLLAGG